MKDRWSQLSISEKSDLMSLYIKNGISSLEEIKKHYNNFADNGEMNTDGHLFYNGGTDDDKYSFLRREPEVAVADNTRYVRPYNSIEMAEARKTYEQEQLQKAIIEAQKNQPQFKADNNPKSYNEREKDTKKKQFDNNVAALREQLYTAQGRPNTAYSQATVEIAPQVAKAVKAYVNRPIGEIIGSELENATNIVNTGAQLLTPLGSVTMAQQTNQDIKNGNYGSAALNGAFALMWPLGFSYGKGMTSGFGQGFNANLGYYGDNTISRFYNTMTRRYNLPSKPQLPELIRRGYIPEIDANGNIILGNPEHIQTNFTTNSTFTPHKHYRYRAIGSEPAMIINPKKIDFTKAFSIEPSDMFFIGDELTSMGLKPEDITIISGKPEELALAESRGFKTQTSERLQQLASQKHSGNFVKGDGIDPKSYRYALQEVIDKRGNPTLDDYLFLRDKAELPIKIEPFHTQQKLASEFLASNDLTGISLSEMNVKAPKIVAEQPLHIEWEPLDHYKGVLAKQSEVLDTPYRKVFYDPTSSVEQDFLTRFGLTTENTSENRALWNAARKAIRTGK